MAMQGEVALLDDPVAQELLSSAIPARLAYVWTDGSPRVVPIYFRWTGEGHRHGFTTTSTKVPGAGVQP